MLIYSSNVSPVQLILRLVHDVGFGLILLVAVKVDCGCGVGGC